MAEAISISERMEEEAEEDKERLKEQQEQEALTAAVAIEAAKWPDINSAPKLDYKENYYSILECDATVNKKNLKKAFYKMVKKYHPDSFPNDEEKKKLCGFQMMVINKVYETLSDVTLRAEYDKKNRRPYRAKSASSAGGFGVKKVAVAEVEEETLVETK